MDANKESNQSSPANPYEPPYQSASYGNEKALEYPLGRVYWLWMILTLLANVLIVLTPLLYQMNDGKERSFLPNVFHTPAIGIGLLGAMICGYALAFGLAYASRVVRRNYIHRCSEVRARQFEFYAQGMLFGVLLTFSTLTAFVCCCVPISMPSIHYSAGGGVASDTTPATAFAVMIGLMAGGFIIFKLLPREDIP